MNVLQGMGGTGQGFDAPSAGRLGAHSFIPMHNPQNMRGAVAKVLLRSALGVGVSVKVHMGAFFFRFLPRCKAF